MKRKGSHSKHTHTHTVATPGQLPASVELVFPVLESPITAEKLDWME